MGGHTSHMHGLRAAYTYPHYPALLVCYTSRAVCVYTMCIPHTGRIGQPDAGRWYHQHAWFCNRLAAPWARATRVIGIGIGNNAWQRATLHHMCARPLCFWIDPGPHRGC